MRSGRSVGQRWPCLRKGNRGSTIMAAPAESRKKHCKLHFYKALRSEAANCWDELSESAGRFRRSNPSAPTEKVKLFDAVEVGFRFLEENANEEG